jgi:phosphatidylglycerophosphate synthase
VRSEPVPKAGLEQFGDAAMKKFDYITCPSNFMQVPVRILSAQVARVLSKTPITPNQVTLFRGILNLSSLFFFALGTPPSLILGFFLFQFFEILDHVDGDLARLKNLQSKIGLFLEWLIDLLEATMYGFLGLSVSIGVYRQTNDFTIFFVFIAITMGQALSPPRSPEGGNALLKHARYEDYFSVLAPKRFLEKLFRFASVVYIWQNQIVLWAALLYYPITKYLHFNPLFWGMVLIAALVQLNFIRKVHLEYSRTVAQ